MLKTKSKENPLQPAVAAAMILLTAYVYYLHNPIGNLLIACFAAYCAIFFLEEQKDGEERERLFILLMAFTSAAAVMLRFYRLFTYPFDFYTDEWNQITQAYFRMRGQEGWFDPCVRFGSSLPYVSLLVISFFMSIFRENLDALRLIPALVSVATAAGLYGLGRELGNKKLGLAMAFIFLTSPWSLVLSRKVMENIYVPLFAVLLLLSFYRFLRTKNNLYAAAMMFLLLGGFFTYSSWALMAATFLFMTYVYREELGGKYAAYLSAGAAVSAAVYAAFYVRNPNAFSWSAGQTVFNSGPGGLFRIFTNFGNILSFLSLPMEAGHLSITRVTFTATGFLFLAAGIAVLLRGIKEKKCMAIAAGLALSSVTLIFGNGIGHHFRHVMLLPFAVIASGYAVQKLMKWKYGYVVITAHAAFFAGSLFYHFGIWESEMKIPEMERRAGEYIKATDNNDTLYIHEGQAYGSFGSYLRTKAAYRLPTEEKIKRLVLLSFRDIRNDVASALPGSRKKIFFDYSGQKLQPLVLVEAGLSGQLSWQAGFFVSMKQMLGQIQPLLWAMDYQKVIKTCEKMLLPASNPYAKLGNTYIKISEFEALFATQDPYFVFESMRNPYYPMFEISSIYYQLGKMMFSVKEYRIAGDFFKRSAELAPEQKGGASYLEAMREKGLYK